MVIKIKLYVNKRKMGIKNLNRFLRVNCPQNIRQISLWDLRGKTIVIDASIYMYRFQTDNSLIEGIYQMVALLEHCKIKPIFVFDGPPPPEKADTLKAAINKLAGKTEISEKYFLQNYW